MVWLTSFNTSPTMEGTLSLKSAQNMQNYRSLAEPCCYLFHLGGLLAFSFYFRVGWHPDKDLFSFPKTAFHHVHWCILLLRVLEKRCWNLLSDANHLLFVHHCLSRRLERLVPVSSQTLCQSSLSFPLRAIDTNWNSTLWLFFSQPFSTPLQYVPPQFVQSNRWNMIAGSGNNMIAYTIHKSSWIITDPISLRGSCTACTRRLITDGLSLSLIRTPTGISTFLKDPAG